MNKAHEEIQMLDKQIMELKKKRTDLWRKAPRQSFDNYTLRQTDGGEVSLADLFGDKNRAVIVLRVAFALNVPVFERPDDVPLVRRAKL